MRKVALFIKVLALVNMFTDTLSAQGITDKGIRIGLNISNFKGNKLEEYSSKMGLVISGYLTFSIDEKFAIQPEVAYSMKGSIFERSVSGTDESGYSYSLKVNRAFTLNYVEIPILGVYSFKDNIRLFAGPYLGIYLNGEEKYESKFTFNGHVQTNNSKSNIEIESVAIKSPDFGVLFGGFYSFGKFNISLRYLLGLSQVSEEQDEYNGGLDIENIDFTNIVIQIGAGYSF